MPGAVLLVRLQPDRDDRFSDGLATHRRRSRPPRRSAPSRPEAGSGASRPLARSIVARRSSGLRSTQARPPASTTALGRPPTSTVVSGRFERVVALGPAVLVVAAGEQQQRGDRAGADRDAGDREQHRQARAACRRRGSPARAAGGGGGARRRRAASAPTPPCVTAVGGEGRVSSASSSPATGAAAPVATRALEARRVEADRGERRAAEVARRLEAVGRVLGQRPHDDVVERRRDAGHLVAGAAAAAR